MAYQIGFFKENYMKHRPFRILAGILLACAMALSALPQTALALTDLGTFTYPTTTTLGSVNKYAVFAQTYNKNNHMEGTIAANYINTRSDAFGVSSNVEQYVDKNEAFCYFAHIVGLGNIGSANSDSKGRDWNVIMPDDTTFDYSYNNSHGVKISHAENGSTVSAAFNGISDLGKTISHVSDTTYQIDFDKAFSDLTTYATAQAAKTDTGVTVSKEGQGDQNTRTIRVTCASGFDVVNVSAADVRDNKIIVEGLNDVTDYSLVINVTDIDTTTAYTFCRQITVDGSRSAYGEGGGKVLWNFGASECNVTFQECNQGVILAPNGSATVVSTHNGSIFAKTVTNNNSEAHMNPFRPQDSASSTTASLSVKKVVDSTDLAYSGMDDFTFTVAMDPDQDSAANTLPVSAAATCKDGETATFGDMTYTRTGDYYYVISEDASGVDDMTDSVARVYAHVSVDSLSEAPVVTYGATSGAYDSTDVQTITNTYTKTASTTASLSVTKAVAGDDYSGTENFVFDLSPITENAPMPQADAQTASCKNGETTSFGTISYTSTDANESYYYKISERAGAIAGMAYSTDKYAKVSVGEVDGVLSAVVTYGDTQAACDAADAATSLTVTNTYTRSFEVSFVKTDARNTFKFLRNCKLQVTSDDGVTAYGDAWYSDPAAPHKIMLAPGSYRLNELEAPDGYDVTSPIYLKVADDGVVTVRNSAGEYVVPATSGQVNIANETWKTITFSKVDATSGQEIGGAQITVTGTTSDGRAFSESWTSVAGQSHTLQMISGTYVMHEASAPDGYALAQDIAFTVDIDGNVVSDAVPLDGAKVVMSDIASTGGVPSTPSTPSVPPASSTSSVSSVPNTGDPFSLALPIGLSVAGIAFVLAVRPWRKSRR